LSVTARRASAVLCDLLMAVMDSPAIWAAAAGGEEAGWAWRDAVTRRMLNARRYADYQRLVSEEAAAQGLQAGSADALLRRWPEMQARPDVAALVRLPLTYAFVTNCSQRLAAQAAAAAAGAGLRPAFVLSAEEAGWYKPQAAVYRQACGLLERDPHEVLYVAGAAYDAEGALAAGLRVTLVARRPSPDDLDPAIRTAASLAAALAETA
jgi:HAD superfamily hydrolase (TIGR01493 family)